MSEGANAGKEKRLRLFVALELPEAWRQMLGEIQSRMAQAVAADRRTARARPRWVRPEGIHLTLKFLGEVAPDRLDSIREALDGVLADMPPLSLTLGDAGSFSDRRVPRVIWLSVSDAPAGSLAALASRVEDALEPAGFGRERRPFRPHLTLARLPDQMSKEERATCARLATGVPLPAVPAWQADHVSLMQSFLGPGGARYEQVGRWPR